MKMMVKIETFESLELMAEKNIGSRFSEDDLKESSECNREALCEGNCKERNCEGFFIGCETDDEQ